MKTPLALIAVAAVASACTGASLYAPVPERGRYGYSQQQLEQDRFRVSFAGNSLTDLTTVENYVLYRSAEVTVENGGDWFEVVGGSNETERQFRGFGGVNTGFNYTFFHPRFGAFGFYDPFFNDVNIREITRYDVSAEIVIGMGDKPADTPRAYNAHDVIDNLDSFVTRPNERAAT